jgi:hypothetical protein
MGSPFPGPTPPYNNPPINPQYYQPSQFFISDITLGQTTLVTTTVDHNYVIGQLIRLLIPTTNSSYQLDEVTGYVISIPNPNQLQVGIDSSRNVNTFVTSSRPNQPQIVSVGDINSGIISNTGRINAMTNVPGAFINISPL